MSWSWDWIILPVFMRSKFLIIIRSPDHTFFMRSKLANNAFLNVDLMIDLLVARTIMRSKFANNAFLNFDLIKNSVIRRSNHYYEFQPHESYKKIWSHDRVIIWSPILISWNSTSWPPVIMSWCKKKVMYTT